MPIWLYIFFSIVISGLIGGVTNHFAIQMLFRPRTEWRIKGRRVPFTPGLIPKRKAEIAQSLGDIVASYLVTPDGMREMLLKPSFQQSIEVKLSNQLEELAAAEHGLSVRELILRFMPEEKWDIRKQELASILQSLLHRGIVYAWEQKGLAGKPLKEIIPGWQGEVFSGLAVKAESVILSSIADGLQSPQGQRMLRKAASSMVERTGGFMGAIAGIFMDEDKLVAKLTPMLVEQLYTDQVRQTVQGMIQGLLSKGGEMSVEDAVRMLSDREDALQWLQQSAEAYLRTERWIEMAEEWDVGEWLANNRERWQSGVSRLTASGLELLARHIHRVLEAAQLPKLVREQVEKFPVEQLEEVVLGVSGREFRAITWLGVLLGGIIGLFQGLLVQFVLLP